jgi:hypothetical protein
MLRRLILSLIATVLAISVLTGLPRSAGACRVGCTPINLILSYVPDVSNWGPAKATGVVELVLAEGEARGRVTGLPSLTGEVYQAWLVNTQTDETLPFGTFNTDQNQRAQFRFILAEDIPDRDWNLFILTVEPSPDAEPTRQSDKHGIGSFFPGRDQERLLPAELPNTGGEVAPASAVGEPRAPAGVADPTIRDRAVHSTMPREQFVPGAATGSATATSGQTPAEIRSTSAATGGLANWGIGLAAVTGGVGFLAGWLIRARRRP